MSVSSSITLMIAAAGLALGAGVSGGMLLARLPAASAAAAQPAAVSSAPLSEQLALSEAQRQQMQRIWEEVRQTTNDCLEDGRLLQRQREDALIALLDGEQMARFEKIAQDYAARFRALARQRDQAFARGVEQTRVMLNSTQRDRYEAILNNRVGGATLRQILRETAAPPPLALVDSPTTKPASPSR